MEFVALIPEYIHVMALKMIADILPLLCLSMVLWSVIFITLYRIYRNRGSK